MHEYTVLTPAPVRGEDHEATIVIGDRIAADPETGYLVVWQSAEPAAIFRDWVSAGRSARDVEGADPS